MKTAYTFEGASRDTFGTGSARALRNEGKAPAVLYSGGSEAVHFAIEEKDVRRQYQRGGFFGKTVTLTIDGKDVLGIPQDLQIHPVNDRVLHADFKRVEAGQETKVSVPVKFLNAERCVGIRRGGALNVVRYDLELICKPEDIPSLIEVDLREMNIGDSVHISHIDLPDNVRPAIDRDYTIAAVAGRVSKATRDAEGEEGEGEDGEASDSE